MAAIARPRRSENWGKSMSKKRLSLPSTAAVTGYVGPVSVRPKRVDRDEPIPFPSDGQTREWWQRLQNAFGAAFSAFVRASL